MASSASKVMFFFLILSVALLPSTLATNYNVCDTSGGWALGAKIDEWLKGLTFHVSDTLHFDFKAPQTVAVVDAAGYLACDFSKAAIIDTSGSFTYTLSHTGTFYFISTGPGDCTLDGGLKLQVSVL